MSGHSKWANIKRHKGKMDAIRGKITTKISREITVAVKTGGADQTGNMRLKLALQKAKENNVPKENIQRAIQKGQGALDGGNYEEMQYEGYGPAGVAVLIEILTDNRNRTAADIRHLFAKNGGNLGETGCVGWMFDKKGLFVIDKQAAGMDEEDLMLLALEAGADDIKSEDDKYEITTSPKDWENVREVLEQHKVEIETAELTMIPQTTVELAGDDAVKMLKLMDALEEHDDVQEVYANFDVDEDDPALA
ncbi:MAG: protein yeeN [Firmicutes bacterium]|nr:protein yeeN [Bacillota bacterium]